MILVTPKQEVERKSEWFCGVKFFRSKFKEVRKRCLNKNSLSRLWFFVHMRQFRFDLYCFFDFFGLDFLNGFPNPFIVRFWSNFLFSQWNFFELYVRTCPAMFFLLRRTFFRLPILPLFRHFAWNLFDFSFFTLIFIVFDFFGLDFFSKWFSQSIQCSF